MDESMYTTRSTILTLCNYFHNLHQELDYVAYMLGMYAEGTFSCKW
jgi:hypothetical protein